jgi:plasmid maintenance system antidote protein VapI
MPVKTDTPAETAIAQLGVPKYVLAAEVRISPSDFARIIRGRQVPTRDQAHRIAERLGSTPAGLFGEGGTAP